MQKIISKEELAEIMKIKGEFLGLTLRNTADFIVHEKGEEGLKKLEETMAVLGHPIKYKRIGTMDSFPINLYALTLVLAQKLFDWSDDKFRELGVFQFKAPLTVRLFIRFFMPIKNLSKLAKEGWSKYYMVGDMKVMELNLEKKYIIARLYDFYSHPLHCQTFLGIIPTMIQMMLKQDVSCKETKCVHRGDEYHEFVLKW